MNRNNTVIYFVALGLLAIFFFLPVHDSVLGHWSFGAMVSTLFGLTAIVFGGWYYYATRLSSPTLKQQDDEYEVRKSLEQATSHRKRKARTRSAQTDVDTGKPSFIFKKKYLGWLFWVVLLSTVMSCQYDWMSQTTTELGRQETVWNADNIPLPHLKDGSQYVSNPDTLIKQQTVDSMNIILHQLDKELGIESAVIIVSHIENEDAFRMAQDVGNKYGIGRKETDKGLVIVVAYADRKYFIAPGRGLESSLTDAECARLARNYLTPFLKQNNPDGGMLKLIEATYALAKDKRLIEPPTEEELDTDDGDDGGSGAALFSTMFLSFWLMLYCWLNDKYQWLIFSSDGTGYTGYGRSRMGGGSSSWGSTDFGRGFGGGFGGGGFGGGYGGGSFGGGGAGGSW